jgi:hypothetical protein
VYIRSTVGKSSVTSNVNDRGQEYDRVKWSWNEGDISMSESKTQSQEMDHSYLTRVFHKLCPSLKSVSPQVDRELQGSQFSYGNWPPSSSWPVMFHPTPHAAVKRLRAQKGSETKHLHNLITA